MVPPSEEKFTLRSGTVPEPEVAGPVESAGGIFAGKDELNLAEFPIALVTDRVPAGEKTLVFEDRVYDAGKKQEVTRRLIVTASDQYGLPTAKDDEVILGLIQLTRQDSGFTRRTVRFRRSDLIRLLAWPDTGPSYRRLALSLHRWLGVSLHYDNAWWDKAERRWTTMGFHILESFKLSNGAGGIRSRVEPPMSRFTWNEDLFRSFQAGYLKQLDLDFYLSLTLPTAKRIYRFLDKRFYHLPEWVFDLREFALGHVGLSRRYEGSIQLVRKLEPAIRELEEKGFLKPLPHQERFLKESSRNWRIRFIRQGQAESAALPTPALELIGALVDRNVTPSTAQLLAASFPEGRIREKIQVLDWLLARGDGRALRSPAGYLVRSIREDYLPPEGYTAAVTRARRKAAEERRVREAEEGRKLREAEEETRQQAERDRVEACWRALSAEEQDRVWREALAAASPWNVRQYRRHEGTGDEHERRWKMMILHSRILTLAESPASATTRGDA
jgi:hypothetical protein